MNENAFTEALRESLGAALSRPPNSPHLRFDKDIFFSKWFCQPNRALFFLFKKNLSCTDISFAELAALLRIHAKCPDISLRKLHFRTLRDFLSGVEEIVTTLSSALAQPATIIDRIITLYAPSIAPVVILEPYYGSCAVFLPPHITVDLTAVCGESGYIHSCGPRVYIRRLDKADKEKFFEELRLYLEGLPRDRKIFFTPYAHEDFTEYDRVEAAELRHGLDDVKIFVEKTYLGRHRLIDVLQAMKDEFPELIIPPPGDYREEHKEIRQYLDKSRTIWLIVDRAGPVASSQELGRHYLICYDQQMYNANPFHIFDENKPAWVAHTTVPHTLIGAMINVTRPWWPASGARVVDPFGGTGTTWLELQKFPGVDAHLSDRAHVTPLLLKDNVAFFGFCANTLRTLCIKLNKLREVSLPPPTMHPDEETSELLAAYQLAIEYFEKDFKKIAADHIELPPERCEELSNEENFFVRLLYYIVLRTQIRHFGALRRGAEAWTRAFFHETDTLVSQIENLIELRTQPPEPVETGAKNRMSVIQGTYSLACTLDAQALLECTSSQSFGQVKGGIDVTTSLSNETMKCDVVIIDPPYGFNTDADYVELAETYAAFIRSVIRSLKDNGQLVLCVPDKSYTGRKIPAFAMKDWLVQQVLAEAQGLHREVVVEAQMLPGTRSPFRPPYFWQSPRALKRAILHFRFRLMSS